MIRENRDGKRMHIAFIGAGKVCHALSFYFAKRHSVSGIYSRSPERAASLSKNLQTKAYACPGEAIAEADLLFITTTDGEIEGVAKALAEAAGELSGKGFAHCSGSLSSRILHPLRDKGAAIFSLHPAQSFSDPAKALEQLPKTCFTVEGGGDWLPLVKTLFTGYANPIVRIAPEDKIRYHAAMVMLSNYTVTLYGLSESLLKDLGMSREDAKRILLPLLESTLSNLGQKGFDALTGPIERGDKATIEQHLQELTKNPELLTLYRQLGAATLTLLGEEKEAELDVFR